MSSTSGSSVWRSPPHAALVATVVVLAPAVSAAAPTQRPVQFSPHRAVYEISLAHAAAGSGVTEVEGRMVYDLQGSHCEGYTQNMRFVTRMTSQDGSEQINDLRSSSFEDLARKRLRFVSSQYRDQKLIEQTSGDAHKFDDSRGIEVELEEPSRRKLNLTTAAYFPMRHSEALVSAARAGQRQLVADLYDGSEKGEKIYTTSAVIGKRSDAAKKLPPRLADGAKKLAGLASWPVSIGYFEPKGTAKDDVPAYELSFRIFENGVSSDLAIDYGEFAVRGTLSELTYYPASDCPGDGPAPR